MYETTNRCDRLKTMKTIFSLSTMKVVFSFLVVILLIALPTYLVAVQPQSYHPLTQVLFDLLLFLVGHLARILTYSEV